MNEIVLPAALPHQTPVLEHPARFKVWRAGRRTGKSRAAVIASIAGHGPQRAHKGVLQGGDIVWLSPDYPQSKAIWREEIKPRLSGLPFVEVHETSKRVEIQGLGSLELRSAESIDGIRGRKLHGIIVDEAAYQDLEYAWNAVIRPALADHQGWAMFISTPNAGQDGNSLKRAPSYFNTLCRETMEGTRGPDWQHFHNRTGDNPRLAIEEVQGLYAEYPEGSTIVQQELDALLIVGGAGLAFPEFSDVHVVPTRQPPKHWRWAASMDWGYRQGSYGLYALGPDGEVEKVWEYYAEFKSKHAKEAAKAIFTASEHFPLPEYIAADEQMWQQVGVSMTLAEEFSQGLVNHFGSVGKAPQLYKGEHKPGSRQTKKNLMHRYLAYGKYPDKDGQIPPWHMPRLRIQERCRDTIRTMQNLPLDVKKLEDVDTTAEDHAYDETCFLLSSRPPLSVEFRKGPDFDVHPGFTESGRPKDMVRKDEPQGYSLPQYQMPSWEAE